MIGQKNIKVPEVLKPVDRRKFNRGHVGKAGRHLKYGEPTVKFGAFFCPKSKEAEMRQMIKDKLNAWEQQYKERNLSVSAFVPNRC